MPNHITNCVEIKHKDPKKMEWLKKCWKENEEGNTFLDFAEIIPPPKDLFTGNLGAEERKMCKEKGIPNWYDWNTDNWGPKWNSYHGHLISSDNDVFIAEFDTAWAPPEPIFDKLREMEFEVNGIWKDEGDWAVNIIGENSGNWYANITLEYGG